MTPRRPTAKKGTMLLVTLGSLFLVTALVIGVLGVTADAIKTSHQQLNRASALNIAESGAEAEALALKLLPYPPSTTSPFDLLGGRQSFGGGYFEVTMTPDPSNGTQFLKVFTIRSSGTFSDVTKTVEIVVRQASFGRFAYFTDSETSSVSGGAIWWRAGERVDGPVHSNNTNGSNFSINYTGSGGPIFLDTVTGGGNTINYVPSRPRDEATFKKVFLNGSAGYKLGVSRIEMPETTDAQKNAAWGGSSGFPTTTGVYLRPDVDGGIYVVGNCTMTLSDQGGNQQIAIRQGSNTTVVTIDRRSGTTTATGPVAPGSPTNVSAVPNGVVYCTGNITSLSGTVSDNVVSNGEITARSELTIVTDVNAGKDISIADNLVYKTAPDKTKDSSNPANLSAGTLGLVARNITVSSSAARNLEIDAVMMAGARNTASGSFGVANYDSKKPTGTLKVLGGIIQKARGAVGTFDPGSGAALTGYSKNYSYDPRLAQNPPPFYPTTGQYERLSWRVVPDDE